MDSYGIGSVSFGAKLIDNTVIQKYVKNTNAFENKSASIVQLNPRNKNDAKALNKAVEGWGNNLFGGSIADAFNDMVTTKKGIDVDKVYAITLQNKGFKKLNSGEIIGIAEMYSKPTTDTADLFYIQVKPDVMRDNKRKNFKHVGQEFMHSLMNKYKEKKISLFSTSEAEEFYQKLGFEKESNSNQRYFWKNRKKSA